LHSGGWETTYYHIENIQNFSGTINQNEKIGVIANTLAEAICSGGSSTGPHVHFNLKHNGALVAINGTPLSGWYVHAGRWNYDTDPNYMWLERSGVKKFANTNRVLSEVPPLTLTGNAGVGGATLNYVDGTPKTSIADGSGNYSISVSYDWSGTVTPSAPCFNFAPASRPYDHVLASQISQDYTATVSGTCVSSILRANSSPTNAATVSFTVHFTGTVTGVDATDFTLMNVGVSGASILNVSGSGDTYTVTVNTGSGDGTIRLDVVDNDTILDGSNNPLGGTGLGNGNFTNGEVYTISRSPTTLVNSILPTSRSVEVGNIATVFGTVLNGGTAPAYGVTLSMANPPSGVFSYQESNCVTNALLVGMNPSLNILAGQARCYVVFFMPSAPFASTDVHVQAQASNTSATAPLPGINTWNLRATSSPGPDMIALTTTTDFHQVACTGTLPFAVAMSNVGATASQVTVTADTGSANLPITTLIQESNPVTGSIIGDNILENVGAGQNRTVVVWVTFNGCVNFDPAAHRIFIRFKDAGNNLIGSTSTAVSTNR
jgi:hypothetical protein